MFILTFTLLGVKVKINTKQWHLTPFAKQGLKVLVNNVNNCPLLENSSPAAFLISHNFKARKNKENYRRNSGGTLRKETKNG